MFELTVSLGSLLTMASFLVGGVIFVYAIKTDTKVQGTSLDVRMAVFTEQMSEMKGELKELTKILVKLTEQDGRIKSAEERLYSQGKRLDETAGRLNAYIDANIFTRMKVFEDLGRGNSGQT